MRTILIKMTGLVLIAGALVLQGCTKSTSSRLVTQSDFSNNSLVRVFVATVNASRNYVYVDGLPITGAPLASGSMFPAAGIYAASIAPGLKAFLVRDTLAAATQVPLSFAENMKMATNYTIFLYDTISSPKQKTVETIYEIPADTSCRIRFANFIYNPSDVPAIDVVSLTRGALFTNVPVTGVTNFIPYPSNVASSPDTLYIRETGTSVNIIKLPISSSTLNKKRSYTLVYRGSHRGTRIATLYTDR